MDYVKIWILVHLLSQCRSHPAMKQLNFDQEDPLLYAQNMDNYYENNFLNLTENPKETHMDASKCGTRFGRFRSRRTSKIIGGVPAIYGEFPWQVQIQHFNFDTATFEHHCGGAVVGERLILSAAHCLQVGGK